MKTMEEANEVTERYATRARDASQPKCFVVTQDALEALRVFTERATAQSSLPAAMLP
jgi:predicted RNA-binding protein with PIN domain